MAFVSNGGKMSIRVAFWDKCHLSLRP